MKPSLNIFFFGWWLAQQCWTSRGKTLSKPLISTNFNGTVALGGNVTIFCRSQDNFLRTFYLNRFTSFHASETVGLKKTVSNQAEFSFSLSSKSQGGTYNCRTCLIQGSSCSSFSDSIYLNLTDPSLSKPSIKVLKDFPYFRIWCEGTQRRLTFALIDSRQQIDYKAAEPGQNGVAFFRNSARLKEVETYTCRYHLEYSPSVWSLPSEPLEFPLKDPGMMNPTMEMILEGSSGSDPEMMIPTMERIPGGSSGSDIINLYVWVRMAVILFLLILSVVATVWFKRRKTGLKRQARPYCIVESYQLGVL
ncbi:leukocyte immunoglobulin-like receptor subfamily B member 2 [Erythrolamprus reginae]|uniref:leukocyte immunoglobulin-like receptor subfamily B member 2 n=1 Tax=Erythrolamprus reginae TaxID=121349 RepID=UPI00396C5599